VLASPGRHTDTYGLIRLFGSEQTPPSEPAVQVQLRMSSQNAATLDELVTKWQAPSRSGAGHRSPPAQPPPPRHRQRLGQPGSTLQPRRRPAHKLSFGNFGGAGQDMYLLVVRAAARREEIGPGTLPHSTAGLSTDLASNR